MKLDKRKKLISIGIAILIVLVTVGIVGALNGWFGGGATIPEDTFTRGLVGYWNFDEGSGTTVVDSSGNGNSGTLNGIFKTVTASGNAQIDTMASSGLFDGTGDYLSLVDSTDWTFGAGAFTIDFWVRFNSLPASDGVNQYLMRHSNTGAYNDSINITTYLSGAQLNWLLQVVSGGTVLVNVYASTTLSTNTWYHMAFVRSGNNWMIFQAGTQLGTTVTDTDAIPDYSGSLTIGARYGDDTSGTDAWLDEFRISKGVARWTSNFTPSTSAYTVQGSIDSSTVLLLEFVGADASPTFADSSPSNKTVTRNGDAQIDTAQYKFSKAKFGTASGLFDGTGDYLSTPDSADWAFGTGDFTIDFWVRFNALPAASSAAVIYSQNVDGTGNNQVDVWIYNNAGAYSLVFQSIAGGTTHLNEWFGVTITTNTWYHMAIVRSGSTWYGFNNGAYPYTTTNAAAVDDLAVQLVIGTAVDGTWWNLNGWLDEFRISKDIARWTANFTPPAAPYTRDSSTVLLLHMDGTDGSTTFLDEPTITPWTTGKLGSGLQFDGVNDYVSLGTTDVFNIVGDITISAWIKPSIGGGTIFNKHSWDNCGYRFELWGDGSLHYRTFQSGAHQTTDSSYNVALGQWNHVVVSRQGTSATIYINGINRTTVNGNHINPASCSVNAEISTSYAPETFNGTIDDVRIYNRALSAAEIRYHYNRGGPVAQWKFDEGSGTSAKDATDNNNDGTISGATWTSGKFGSALSFDGTDDYVNISTSSSIDDAFSNITIVAWIKPNDITTDHQIVVRKWNLKFSQTYSRTDVQAKIGGVYKESKGSTGDLTVGQWAHVAVVYGIDNYLHLYVNGREVAYTTKEDTGGGPIDSSTDEWYIGQTDAPPQFFNGTIDEVRIYNYARTADEIVLDYNAGMAARFGPSSSCEEDPGSCMTQGLVGYWGMDEGAGTTAYDGSGNSNTGTLTNGPKWTTGKVGGALSFDGLNDYVTVPDSNDWYFGTAGKTVTANGGAQIDTAQSEFGGASGLFDGTGDYLSTPSTADWDFGTGNFTIDFWVYRSGTGGEEAFCGLVSTRDPSANTGWLVAWDEGGNGEIQFNNDGTILLTATETLTMNTWTHVALVRNGNTLTVYYGGVSKGSADITGVSINDDANLGLMIGRRSVDVDSYYHKGWLDEFRTSKGVALWTSNFTPPTVEYVADSYTKLLLHMNGTDASTTFLDGPYDPDFTIEFWVRFNALPVASGFMSMFEQGPAIANRQLIQIYNNAGTYVLNYKVKVASADQIIIGKNTNPNLATNTWYHFAVVRSGNTFYLFQDGTSLGTTTDSDEVPDYAGSCYIGSSVTNTINMNGWLDEFRIYKNRALSVEEIRYHYNHTLPKGALSPTAMKDDPSLVAYWSLNEGSGSIAYDNSNNSNNGTISGATWSPGISGNALSFDGLNDYVSIPDSDDWHLSNNKLVTAVDDAQIDTAQSKFGGASGLFDGTGDYLSLDDSADWFFNGSDFTIDFRLRLAALPADGNSEFLATQFVSTTDRWIFIYYNSSGTYQYQFYLYSGGSTLVSVLKTSTLSINTWYHVALVRSGSSWYVFQDGAQVGTTVTSSQLIPDLAGSLYIGQRGSGSSYLNGWLDEFRISKGIARWTANFTPPTAAYGDDGYTKLLLHMDGSDASTTFQDDSGILDFTIDFWVKFISVPTSGNYMTFYAQRAWDSLSVEFNIEQWGDQHIVFQVLNDPTEIISYDVDTTAIGSALTAGTWYHIAIIRYGDDCLLFLNGIQIGTTGTFSGSIPNISASLKIGTWNSNRYLNGWLDEFRIYKNRALSAEEIYQHYINSKYYLASHFGPKTSCAEDPGSCMGYGLVGYWGMDEGAGTTAYDGSGNSNTGTLTNGPKWTTGKVGGALSFDGVNDYVTVPDSNDWYFGTGDFTIDFWVRFNSLPATEIALCGQGWDGSHYKKVVLDNWGGSNFALQYRTESLNAKSTSAYVWSTGVWYHIAIVRYGSSWYFFINGSALGGAVTIATADTDVASALQIGDVGTSEYTDGWLDEFRIYKRALSAEESRYHYNRGGPVGYWKFDEGEGTTAYDFTDNNKDCIISGADWIQGKYGSALDFTPNANLSCGNIYNGVKTVSFWLRADNLTNYAMDLNGTQTITISSGAISANNFTSPTIYVDGKKSSTLPDLNWHHIAITTSSGINASAVYLGKVSTSYFDGILDDVRFYQYERTPEQILQDYNAGLSIYFK
jgi:hypothetical protein